MVSVGVGCAVSSVRSLVEDGRDDDYNLYVFITNQSVTGEQELNLEDEIREEYGWTLRLYHRDNLLGELRQNSPELADRHLDIDLGTDHDHRRHIKQFRDDRITAIRDRDGYASSLPNGSIVALHVIPNGLFSQAKKNAADLPHPPVLGKLIAPDVETRGQERIAYNRRGHKDCLAYGALRNDGLYESADWLMIRRTPDKEDEAWANATVSGGDEGLDASVVITVKHVMAALREAGFSGAAFVSLSVLDAAHAKLGTPQSRNDSLFSPPKLGTDVYTTNLQQVAINTKEIIADLEPVLSELWREFGYEDGTTNITDGRWTGGSVTANGQRLIESGDK